MGMLCKVLEVWPKNCFYDELKCVWDMCNAVDLVMCLYLLLFCQELFTVAHCCLVLLVM